jgi:4-amino-4-deoxy-L-arabinose transferase-like glycosyltransferase
VIVPRTRFRPYLLLTFLVLLLRLVTALPLERAGYMDASYTQHVGSNLARGRGFTQDVVWNYLEGQKTIPGPSNLYWLPLPAVLAGGAMALFGVSYHAAQVPFVFLSLIPPLLAFYLARRLYGRDDYAWVAGLLTACSGFYTIYWVSPDNFTPFAVTADLALLCIAFGVLEHKAKYFFLAGVFAGLAQLARADAVLLLLVIPILWVWRGRMEFAATRTSLPSQTLRASAIVGGRLRDFVAARVRRSSSQVLIASAGFLLVLAPWLARNALTIGAPFAPGSAHTLWLLNYDEFFRYDVSRLTLARYLDWGIGNILASKWNALGFILLVLLFGVWQIYLAPFAVIGFWKMRARVEVQAALVYLALLVLAMAFVFTFPATHGSMLHSASALVAYGAVAVPPGLDAAIAWMAKRRRRWNVAQAQTFFRYSAVALAIFFSLFLYAQGVWIPPGNGATSPLWNQRDVEYAAIDRELDARGVPDEIPVITVDPPSFINETGRRAIYMPTESIDAIFDAARQFGARYLVLQYDKPVTMRALYDGKATVAGLNKIATVQDGLGRPVTLFEITK